MGDARTPLGRISEDPRPEQLLAATRPVETGLQPGLLTEARGLCRRDVEARLCPGAPSPQLPLGFCPALFP